MACADAQADLSLRWAQSRFAGFVMGRLISFQRTKCILKQNCLLSEDKKKNEQTFET